MGAISRREVLAAGSSDRTGCHRRVGGAGRPHRQQGPPQAVGLPLVLPGHPAPRSREGGGGDGPHRPRPRRREGLARPRRPRPRLLDGLEDEPGSIPDGLNDPRNHDAIVNGLIAALPRAKKAGVPNLIAFFGNRKGMSDADAIKNCVIGLNRVKQAAEEHGVNVCVELLNSKVDHKDYQGDRTSFGVEVVRQVDSPRVRLLYDIYHMQIMEGDVIRTIREQQQWIAHYHTGGVPGRHELDDTQELNWGAVARAIAETGFTGYVAHEFVPTRDPLTSLREAVTLCDV